MELVGGERQRTKALGTLFVACDVQRASPSSRSTRMLQDTDVGRKKSPVRGFVDGIAVSYGQSRAAWVSCRQQSDGT